MLSVETNNAATRHEDDDAEDDAKLVSLSLIRQLQRSVRRQEILLFKHLTLLLTTCATFTNN